MCPKIPFFATQLKPPTATPPINSNGIAKGRAPQDAERPLQKALSLRRQLHLPPHPDLAESMHALGWYYFWLPTQRDSSIYYFRKATEMRRTLYGDTHADARLANYPNPFQTATTITYHLPDPAEVNVSVYNLFGQRVATLVEGIQSAGEHRVTWGGTDWTGTLLASGPYFYRLQTAGLAQIRKLLLIR